MEPKHQFRRRHLPHWDVPGATFFVTACQEGSIPAQGLLDIRRYQSELARRARPPGTSETDWELRQWKLAFARADHWLDRDPGVRHLADPAVAAVVADALLHFAGTRYDVLALVVMPSHFHWVFRPLDSWVAQLQPTDDGRSPRERIMHSVKSYSAHQCNRMLSIRGTFWQAESYDHWVRDADELARIIDYVEQNPVKAGLCARPGQWCLSSAALRRDIGLPFGSPLPRLQFSTTLNLPTAPTAL